MNRTSLFRKTFALAAMALMTGTASGQPAPATMTAFRTYVAATEARIAGELQTDSTAPPQKNGDVRVWKVDRRDIDGGLIHHWAGAVFVPGVRLDQVLDWVRDYDQHHSYFTEVDRSRLVSRNGDEYRIYLRLARTKIITVHYDTYHTVTYRRHSPTRASSRSIATEIAELANANSSSERPKPPGEDHGFLWALNSYWKFREESGGVFIECESVSLSRSIPTGLDWLVGRYVDSAPRESMGSTLASMRKGIIARNRNSGGFQG
jgi:hypothetical protein